MIPDIQRTKPDDHTAEEEMQISLTIVHILGTMIHDRVYMLNKYPKIWFLTDVVY